jgi:hypothetical protein
MELKLYIKIFLIIFILLFFSPINTPIIVFSEKEDIISIFTPFAFLQYGPSPEQAITLYFVSSLYKNGNETIEIYNPHTRINNLSSAEIIVPTDDLQPSFDSYFLFNRMNDQIIPHMSNFSIKFAPIINPEQVINHLTQIKTGDSIYLIHNNSKSSSPKLFSIPSELNSGYYLITLSVYLPDYNVYLKYSNVVIFVDRSLTSSQSPLMGSNTSLTYNPNQSSTLDYSYLNDTPLE